MTAGNDQTATLTNVASSATSVPLFAAAGGDVDRRYVFNDSTSTLYIALTGTPASITNYTFKVLTMAGQGFDGYGGAVTGIWEAANGSARCTEW